MCQAPWAARTGLRRRAGECAGGQQRRAGELPVEALRQADEVAGRQRLAPLALRLRRGHGRLADCRRLVQLAGRRSPAAGRRLADLIFVQSGPGVYADLVNDGGWTGPAYETWLAETMEVLLSS